MINFREYMPSEWDTPFLAKTKYGLRKIERNSRRQFFKYIDCTYPEQNCYCNPFDIEEWEYLDKYLMDEMLFCKSWVGEMAREREANNILANIKVSKLDTITFYIRNFFKKLLNK